MAIVFHPDILYRMAFAGIRGMGYELAQRLLDIIPSEKDFFAQILK